MQMAIRRVLVLIQVRLAALAADKHTPAATEQKSRIAPPRDGRAFALSRLRTRPPFRHARFIVGKAQSSFVCSFVFRRRLDLQRLLVARVQGRYDGTPQSSFHGTACLFCRGSAFFCHAFIFVERSRFFLFR